MYRFDLFSVSFWCGSYGVVYLLLFVILLLTVHIKVMLIYLPFHL